MDVPKQVLATGVHGILLCHADTPDAIRAFVEAMRFPTNRQGVGDGRVRAPGRSQCRDRGVMIGPASQETAEMGRKFTKQQMRW